MAARLAINRPTKSVADSVLSMLKRLAATDFDRRLVAKVFEMLYSTCIWETGTVNAYDFINNIISRVSTKLTGRRTKLTVCTKGIET